MIVKSVRAVGRAAGQVIDEEDRKFIGQGLVLLLCIPVIASVGAATAGLAILLFRLTSGI